MCGSLAEAIGISYGMIRYNKGRKVDIMFFPETVIHQLVCCLPYCVARGLGRISR